MSMEKPSTDYIQRGLLKMCDDIYAPASEVFKALTSLAESSSGLYKKALDISALTITLNGKVSFHDEKEMLFEIIRTGEDSLLYISAARDELISCIDLMNSYAAPSLIGNVCDNLQAELKPLLHESVVSAGLKIGNEDSVILAVGSMGYSTVNMWMNQGFEISSKVVFVLKSNDVEKGQPDILPDMHKWIVKIENEDKSNGAGYIRETQNAVSTWLKDNVQGRKLILVGGLGKTTSTLLIPVILTQAKKLGIETQTICTLPLWFETSRSKEIADSSLEIIKRMSGKTVYFENLDMVSVDPDSSITINDAFGLVGNAIAVVINEQQFKKEDYFMDTHHIHVFQKGNHLCDTSSSAGTCGTFEASII